MKKTLSDKSLGMGSRPSINVYREKDIQQALKEYFSKPTDMKDVIRALNIFGEDLL